MATNRRAVVLLSGGIDSATTLALAIRDGFAAHALSLRYGQRHAVELEAARRVATSLGVADHRVIAFDLRAFGGSALTDDVSVPKDRPLEEMDRGIPATYVPARNTIFLAYALAWAEVLGAGDIFLGVNAGDHGGYPDCRPEYLAAFEALANLATKAGVEGRCHFRLHAPLIRMAKPEIIRLGVNLGIDFALTFSCYDPSPEGQACGRCDACALRRAGFVANGLSDPAAGRPLTAGRVQ